MWIRIIVLLVIPSVVSSFLSPELSVPSFASSPTSTIRAYQRLINGQEQRSIGIRSRNRNVRYDDSPSLFRLSAVAPPMVVGNAFTGPAVKFFQSLRVPAALIAGSSLTAFFLKLEDSTPHEKKSILYYVVLYLYHILSSISLMLSLNVIVTATAASNTLLIGSDYHHMNEKTAVVAAKSMLDFLHKKNIVYEFIVTRWCFYMSLISFIQAVTCRTLIAFHFLRKDRTRYALVVLLAMTAFIAHIVHLLNDCVYVYPNLFFMTIGLFKLYLQRIWTRRSAMLLVSFGSFLASLGLFVSILPGWIQQTQEKVNRQIKEQGVWE